MQDRGACSPLAGPPPGDERPRRSEGFVRVVCDAKAAASAKKLKPRNEVWEEMIHDPRMKTDYELIDVFGAKGSTFNYWLYGRRDWRPDRERTEPLKVRTTSDSPPR